MRFPMIWFLSSLRALSLISESAEPIRTMRSDEARRWLDEAEAEGEAGVGMVCKLRTEFHASSGRKLWGFLRERERERNGNFEFLKTFFFFFFA